MSSGSDDVDSVANGITLIDTDTDSFSLALYSRIQDIVDVEPTDSYPLVNDNITTAPSSGPTESTELTDPPTQLPPTFMTRIREKLQSACQEPTLSTASTPEPESEPTSFLDIAEQQLQDYYDRVLTEDTLVNDSMCNGSVFRKLTPDELDDAFRKRYGKDLKEVEKPIRDIVRHTINDYKAYFEAEQDILETAKRYDTLQTWLKHTCDVFGTVEAMPTQELEDKLRHYMTDTPEWKKKFADATQLWSQLCTSRQSLRNIHDLVGGTSGCRICFNKQVKTLLVPCGHVLCADCANRVTVCPFCNASFYARQEMFFM